MFSGIRCDMADGVRRRPDLENRSRKNMMDLQTGCPAAHHNRGLLVINADDWGRDRDTTQRIFECFQRKTVSAVSAMVFMEDSERAASTAREHGIDAGLHLNFTTPFSALNTPKRLVERQHEEILPRGKRHDESHVSVTVAERAGF